MLPLFGGIAQLGERLHGMQEVSGSIPLTSTNLRSAVVQESPETRRNAGFFMPEWFAQVRWNMGA